MGKRIRGLYLSSLVSPGSGTVDKESSRPVTAEAIQRIARRMEPFYARIALGGLYAEKWSDAVVKLKLKRMERLLKLASPKVGRIFIGTNGIGYSVSFPIPSEEREYMSGTTIPPGTVQIVFEPRAHCEVAAAVLPLYRTLAGSRPFAAALARAIGEEDSEAAARLVKGRIRSEALKSISLEPSGIAMTFRFTFSKYPYRNLLLQEMPEGE